MGEPPPGSEAEAGSVLCRLQYLEDSDPFSSAAFPEPRRAPTQSVLEALPLAAQLPAMHRLLGAPLPLDDCALQLLSSGLYLDLELSLLEQKEMLEGFYEDISKGRRPILLLRTQLSVRVHTILEKLYTSKGPELRRSLFSLKQLFQEDKDLVPEFVNSEGLRCLITVGAEADQNYQNYILRALGQVMLFVDGMMGVINHNETVQWLYMLCGSLYRLVVKTALKLLLLFVEFTESNAQLLIQAVVAAEQARGGAPWSCLIAILELKSGADTELQVFAITLINKTLAALPDQDSFYDVTDCLEQQGMERIIQQHVASAGADPDLKQQLGVYESALRYEDGIEEPPSGTRKERRKGDESRRGRRSWVAAQEESQGGSRAAATEEVQPSPAQESSPEGFGSLYSSSASNLQLSVPPVPAEGEQLGSLGDRSIFKLHASASAWREEQSPPVCGEKPVVKRFEARFLENLAASQKEKMSAICRGRAEVLAEASLGPELVAAAGEWNEGQNHAAERREPGAMVAGFGHEEASARTPGEGHAPTSDACLSAGQGSVLPGNCADRGSGSSSIASKKQLMLDMLFSQKAPVELERALPAAADERQEGARRKKSQEEDSSGRVKGAAAAAEVHSDLQAWPPLRTQSSIDAEASLQNLEGTLMTPFRRDLEVLQDPLAPQPPLLLKIRDLDFSDLGEEEDFDVLATEVVGKVSFQAPQHPPAGFVPPPPPPPPGCPPPPPGCPPPPPGCPPPPPPPGLLGSPQEDAHSPAKKKKTVKLFWRELKPSDGSAGRGRFGQATLWASLEKVEVDTAKLEHLFESKAKEMLSAKKVVDGKKTVVVLDPKRSNAINIGLTVLPPVHIIKTAILNFDEFAISKEGIEKISTMVPTEEEKQKIQEAQLANPDVPLGSAEQFLLALSSIPELSARLQLWAFKLDYETAEQEVAEPLFDLKVGMEQLARNRTFRCILATLLAMGNFLNGSQSRGFELSYLAKVSEVKDTVHRQTLLHHLCHSVVEKFPDTTDLYSEIAAITRSAKVDFDELAESLVQLERRCKASWDSLKAIAKHEAKPALKSKLLDFLKASTKKIVVLKVVHRRVVNRFRSFLLFLGYDAQSVQDVKIMGFCRTLREFALEYRTCRERVLQQRKKRAAYRERNKTRGKMITEFWSPHLKHDIVNLKEMQKRAPKMIRKLEHLPYKMERFANLSQLEDKPAPAVLSASPAQEGEAGHESMTSILISPAEPSSRRSRASRGVGKLSPTCAPQDDASGSPEDASEEMVDHLVKYVTQSTPPRPGAGKERKRSRGNRKSLRRTLKSGLSDELVQALGLAQAAGVAV